MSGFAWSGSALPLAVTFLGLAITTIPLPHPARPVIALTPEGVWLLPFASRRRTWLSWDHKPALTSVTRISGEAVITCASTSWCPSGRSTRFDMAYPPLGYAQLGRVLELFSAHLGLRPALAYPEGPALVYPEGLALAYPEGLALVQALMHTPLEEIERRLAGGAGTPPR